MASVWTTCLKGGPKKVNHAAALVGKDIYSFGGFCMEENMRVGFIDVHILCTVTNRWKVFDYPAHSGELAYIPFQRYGHTAVAHGTKIYIWGGKNESSACNRLYCFDTVLQKWSCPEVGGTIPSARDGHTACIINNKMYIFGGFADELNIFGDGVYALDLNTMRWSLIHTRGEEPTYRDFHSAVAVNGRMYVFGGRGGVNGPFYTETEVYNNDMYIFDPETEFWIKISSQRAPIGRRSLGMVPFGKRIYIFGGYNGIERKFFNDVHYYDTELDEWSGEIQTHGAMPCKRRRHCTIIVNDQVFVFGGTGPSGDVSKTLEHLDLGAYNSEDSYLTDYDDLYVLHLKPKLRTLCMLAVIRHNLNVSCLPDFLQRDIMWMTTNNKLNERI